jgi:hypothetical protein
MINNCKVCILVYLKTLSQLCKLYSVQMEDDCGKLYHLWPVTKYSLSWLDESSLADHEKVMQVVAEHTLCQKYMNTETVSCINMQNFCYCLPYRAITAPANNSLMCTNSLCVHDLARAFRRLIHVFIYFTELRWWNIRLNNVIIFSFKLCHF